MPPRPGTKPQTTRYDDDEDERYDEPPKSRRRDDDDEYEERPARKASRRDEEDDDEPPRRSRSRRDEEEEEDERPRSRGRARDADDDDDRPRSRAASRRDADDEGEEEEEEEGSYATGWEGAAQEKAKSSGWSENFKPDADPKLIKFLQDGPVVSFQQHWVQRKGRMSFVCAGTTKCPLCALGDDPRAQYAFAVAEIDSKGRGTFKLFQVAGRVMDQLKKFNDDPLRGPLTKGYYAVTKSGKRQTTTINFVPVKARDLVEDYGVDPLSRDDVDKLTEQIPTPASIAKPNIKQLREVAAETVGGDDEDDD